MVQYVELSSENEELTKQLQQIKKEKADLENASAQKILNLEKEKAEKISDLAEKISNLENKYKQELIEKDGVIYALQSELRKLKVELEIGSGKTDGQEKIKTIFDKPKK